MAFRAACKHRGSPPPRPRPVARRTQPDAPPACCVVRASFGCARPLPRRARRREPRRGAARRARG
eukprot:6825581-Prymnesium_polylepis.1